MLALTATASQKVRDDVVASLALRAPSILARSFNRPNIHYSVEYVDLMGQGNMQLASMVRVRGHHRQLQLMQLSCVCMPGRAHTNGSTSSFHVADECMYLHHASSGTIGKSLLAAYKGAVAARSPWVKALTTVMVIASPHVHG